MFSRVFETTTPKKPYQGLFSRTSRFEAHWDNARCPGALAYSQSSKIFEACTHIPGNEQYAGFRACNSHSNDHIKAIHEADITFGANKRICLIDWPLSSRGAKIRTLVAFSAVLSYTPTELMARYKRTIDNGADQQVEDELHIVMADYMEKYYMKT
jgi:hypothetical protein